MGKIFLVVQWLRLCSANARDRGSIPGQGTKILHSAWQSPKMNKKKKKEKK